MTTNKTGTINIARPVAATIPPNTVQPIVLRATELAPVASASGRTPSINAMDVINIGRRRSRTASSVPAITSMPRSTLSLANSTIRMAFFADRPISVINPICAYTLLDSLVTIVSAIIAPNTPIGTASNTENGTDQLSYNAARNRNTNTTDNAKIYTELEPDFISCKLSPENS